MTKSQTSLYSAHLEKQHALLQRAASGEDVRNEVILQVQPYLEALAGRIHHRLSRDFKRGDVIEVLDLVNSANVTLLECYAVAITKENPFGYLFRAAKFTMFSYLNGRMGHTINARNRGGPIPVLSLDVPTESGLTLADRLVYDLHLPEAEHTPQRFHDLLRAVDRLPEKQSQVIKRRFGLDGYPEESLYQMSRKLSSSPHSNNAHFHYRRGLKNLLFQSCSGKALDQ